MLIPAVSKSFSYQARQNGQNYVFALLTGYRDPPAGVSVIPALHITLFFIFCVTLFYNTKYK